MVRRAGAILIPIFVLLVLWVTAAGAGAAASGSRNPFAAGARRSTAATVCPVPSAIHASVQAAVEDKNCAVILLDSARYNETLVIDRPVTITGAGAASTVLSGQGKQTVILVETEAKLLLSNVTVTRGSSSRGGGILNKGHLKLDGAAIVNNVATVDGGGIFNTGVAVINNSTIQGNEATDFSGGGLRNEGQMYLNNSTVCLNKARFSGGGISNEDAGQLWIHNSTITANRGGVGGGVAGNEHGDGLIRIQNTILSKNRNIADQTPADCARTIRSLDYNLVSSISGCDLQPKANDLVGWPAYLADRSGTPAVYPLTAISPAIDRGDPSGCKDHRGELLLTDQRGSPRVGRCDIGAVEFNGIVNRYFVPLALHAGCPDYRDDFADERSGWPVGEDEFVKTEYLQGEYRILSKRSEYIYLFLAPSCPRSRYALQAQMRWEGRPGATYGLLFAADPALESFHALELNTDYQLLRIVRVDDTGVVEVTPVIPFEGISEGNGINEVRVLWENGRMSAFVNRVKVGEWPAETTARPTYVGLFAGSYMGQDLSDARFDNFEFATIDQGSQDAPADLAAGDAHALEPLAWPGNGAFATDSGR